MPIPVIPEGEDQTSFARHNHRIQLEMKKTRPNLAVINDLISHSFAMRRHDILDNSYDLETVFQKYPFLREPEQVYLA